MSTNTSNKGYIIQSVGENVGTWGTQLNNNMINIVDLNVGGTYSLDVSSPGGVAPAGTFTVSSPNNQNVILYLSGNPSYAVWTSITITVNDLKGFIFVDNQITLAGGQTLYPEIRIKNNNNATYGVVPTGTRGVFVSDNTNGVRIAANTGVNNFSAGTTGLTPSTSTKGDVTLAGTLIVSNGGTGRSTLTANNLLAGNGTGNVNLIAPAGAPTALNNLIDNGTTWSSAASTFTNMSSAKYSTTVTNSTGTPMVNTGTGTFTFTIPANVNRLKVTVVGGGGSGGTYTSGIAAGGGGGGTAIKWFSGLTPGTVVNITVGKGGTAPASTAVGNAGAASTFGPLSGTTLTGNGGQGGTTNGNAVLGGTATGGDLNIGGGTGGATPGSGSPSGFGGGSFLSPGIAGKLPGQGAAILNATGYGGGGAGGWNSVGGNGADGIVMVEW